MTDLMHPENLCDGASSSTLIILRVEGQGHVPSFKNKKRMMRGNLVTDPKTKRWMERCIQSFMSQLLLNFQTITGVTSTGQPARYSIALSLPQDDSWRWIPQILVKAEQVQKGEEGATVFIQKL